MPRKNTDLKCLLTGNIIWPLLLHDNLRSEITASIGGRNINKHYILYNIQASTIYLIYNYLHHFIKSFNDYVVSLL